MTGEENCQPQSTIQDKKPITKSNQNGTVFLETFQEICHGDNWAIGTRHHIAVIPATSAGMTKEERSELALPFKIPKKFHVLTFMKFNCNIETKESTMSDVAIKETAVSRLMAGLKEFGGLKGRDIANILGVSPPTVSRWSRGEGGPTIEKQSTIAELRWVAERLSDFYEPDEVRLWLQSPHPQLDAQKPYDLINAGRTNEVLEVIERLDSGVYL